MQALILSLLAGASYWLLVGFFLLPTGVGASLFWSALSFVLLRDLRHRGVRLRSIEVAWMACVTYLSLSLSWTTNQLMILVTTGMLSCLAVWFYMRRFYTFEHFTHILGWWHAFQSITEGISPAIASIRQRLGKIGRADAEVVRGILLSTPVLLILHLLFASVNEEYAAFMERLLRFISSQDFLRFCGAIVTHGWVIIVVASIEPQISEKGADISAHKSQSWGVLVGSVAGLFLLFLCFQISALAWITSGLPFKSLSTYVQLGFWQLVAASAIGYVVLMCGRHLGRDISNTFSIDTLTRSLLVALIALVAVSIHKVGLLQTIFGFKDQRLAADLVLLILSASVAVEIASIRWAVCRISWIGSLVVFSVTTMNSVNIDTFATRVNPIRYFVGDRSYRDLSYLLTNSSDNYASWGELMREADFTPLEPQDYYWGHYSSLCAHSSRSALGRFEIEEYHQDLIHSHTDPISSLRQLGKFNFREYYAYRWLVENEQLVAHFYTTLAQRCSKEA